MTFGLVEALKACVIPALVGVAMQATPALADDPAPADSGTIVVTGTLIAGTGIQSTPPVTSISAQDIQLAGTARIEDVLNALPQVYAGQTSNISAGATGTATVDLRGLGPDRTLVLINGRRLMPGDPGSAAADLNFIPASLVKRVDVLTGGASATYGADAVAGVVNFVMDTNFTGFRLDASNGFFLHENASGAMEPLLGAAGENGTTGLGADGRAVDATLSYGSRFGDGRGHVMAYLGYRSQNPVAQSQRDYSGCTLQNEVLGIPPSSSDPLECGGSPYSANGNALFYIPHFGQVPGTLGPGTLTPLAATEYNTAPQNYFQRPDERYTAGAFADYAVSSAFHPYAEFMFMADHTTAQLAPSGDFGDTLTINCDNPMLSVQQHGLLCSNTNKVIGYLGGSPLVTKAYAALPASVQALVTGLTTPAASNTAYLDLLRRNVEGDPRSNDLRHTSFRTVIGAKGGLGHGWHYDAWFQYGRTNYSETYRNEVSKARLANALDVISVGGVAECVAKFLGSDPACVPYDVFSGSGPSAAALHYINANAAKQGATTETIVSAQLTGDLGSYGVRTPWARDGMTLVLGGQWRRESLWLNTDAEYQAGDLAGQGGPSLPSSGAYSVAEFVTEANLPLVQDRLSLDGGFRLSRYSVSNGQAYTTTTGKLNLDFAPVRDLHLSGGIDWAQRAPDIQELFAGQYVGIDATSDPCAGRVLTLSDAGCLAQGLHVGQYVQPSLTSTYNGERGGSANLRPELAITKTLGAVFRPHQIRALSLGLDWFEIRIKHAIEALGGNAILASCTNDLNAMACGLIHRDAAGSLWLSPQGYVADLPTNIGFVQTRGIDFNAAWATPIGRDTLSFSLTGTLMTQYLTSNGLGPAYDCVGYFGPTCGTPEPRWRHQARVTYALANGWSTSLQWRFTGAADVQYLSPNPALAGFNYDYSAHIGGQSYFDLSVSKRFGRNLLLRAGVNNILDADPPLITSGSALGGNGCALVVCNGNTYPGSYDPLGRYIYMGVTLDL